MDLTPERLRQISDSVGVRVGWNFSRVRAKRAPVPWDYSNVVRQFLANTDHVLDIGTGGGELFLALAPHFRTGVGIDISKEMIEQGLRNKRIKKLANVDFSVMDGSHLGFADAQFEIVLNRHCDVNVSETARVLRPRGYFVTQQVANRNTLNILKAFGWTPASFGEGWWQPVEELAAAFEQSGCRVAAKAEYDVRYWFCDVESLVFWLKSAPLPEPFDVDKHWEGVNRILQEHSTEHGIETNEHRELLIVEKQKP
jgi:SAM-dependent methyltransferase